MKTPAVLGLAMVMAFTASGEGRAEPAPRPVAVDKRFECIAEAPGDGDTWTCSGIKIRGYGFDAPELDQPFGGEARDRLATLIADKPLTCERKGRSYKRIVARCAVNGRDIGSAMVADGMAWNSPEYGDRYGPEEASAWCGRLGIWSVGGVQVPPWTWRKAEGCRP